MEKKNTKKEDESNPGTIHISNKTKEEKIKFEDDRNHSLSRHQIELSEALNLLKKLKIRSKYIISLFNLDKIDFHDIRNSRYTYLKALGAFFFCKNWMQYKKESFIGWQKLALSIMQKYLDNHLNSKHNIEDRKEIHVLPDNTDQNIEESELSVKQIPYVLVKNACKERVWKEANLSRMGSLSHTIIPRRWNSSTNINKGYINSHSHSCSSCQELHGEKLLNHLSNRGRANYFLSNKSRSYHHSFDENNICNF